MRFSRVCVALGVATLVSAAVGLWYVAPRSTVASGLGFGEDTAALRQRLAQAGVRVEGYEFRWLRGDLYEVTGPHGRRRVLNFADAAGRQDRPTLRAPKVIEIRVPEVDTTGFAVRFRDMATLPISNRGEPTVVSDTDQDGLVEITAGAGWVDQIWERMDAASDSFHMVYEITERFYGSVLTSDVNSNGLPELVFQVAPDTTRKVFLRFLEGPSQGELATAFVFEHVIYDGINQSQQPRQVDLDQDGSREVLYQGLGQIGLWSFVGEYADSVGNLQRVGGIRYPGPDGDLFFGDWAVGDFDLDGRMEFATGDIDGLVYLAEHTRADNDYALTWQDTVPTFNAYFHTEGDDLDGDGRPECFLGGASSIHGVWTNVITCFETVGDNRYEPTVELRITGAGGLNQEYLLQEDVDGDGEKELVLSTGNVVMVLKAVGDDDYKVYWLKRFPDEASVQVGDIDGVGGLDLTVSFTFRIQTEVYVSRLPTRVQASDEEASPPQGFRLYPNYPNPFNPQTTIRYLLPGSGKVRLRIMNVLGQVVRTLVDGLQERGEHAVVWDGRSDAGWLLPSGMYMVEMQVTSAIGRALVERRKLLLMR